MTLRPERGTGSGSSENRDYFKERGGFDIYNESDDWFTSRGRTESDRYGEYTHFSYGENFDDFDPWNRDYRNHRARRFWEDMETQFGGQDYDYYFTQNRNIYDEFDDAEFEDLASQWEAQFRDRIFQDHNWDFESNYDPRNENHQRYHYYDKDNWANQRAEYERASRNQRYYQEEYDRNQFKPKILRVESLVIKFLEP